MKTLVIILSMYAYYLVLLQLIFLFKHFLSLPISSHFAENKYVHDIYSPLYGRSSEKRLDPVTLQLTTPSLLKKMEHILNIFHSRWSMVVPSLITTTAYLTLALVGSLEHVNSSPTAAARLSLYT